MEACSIASVAEGSTGENDVAANSPKLGHPSGGVEQRLPALAASWSQGLSRNAHVWALPPEFLIQSVELDPPVCVFKKPLR